MARRKYDNLYKRYQQMRNVINANLRTMPKSAQAWKAFRKERIQLYGSKSRKQGYVNLAYPRSRKQAERMMREYESMQKVAQYQSLTERGRERIQTARSDAFDAAKHDLTDQEFQEWIKESYYFRVLLRYDSEAAIRYAAQMESEPDKYDQMDKLGADIEKDVKNPNNMWYNPETGKMVKRLLNKEKDLEIARRMSEYFEKKMASFDDKPSFK